MDTKVIALVGGSGQLGKLIADEVLALPDTRLRLLVRPGSRNKVADLERRGAQIVEGSIEPGADGPLAAFTAGATTVVSAVQGGPDIIVDGQAALLRAARNAGVRRFIPSDFSLDMFKVAPGQITNSDIRRAFAGHAAAERGDVEVVHVLNGQFLDRRVMFGFIRVVDPEAKVAYVWGDGEHAMDFTTYADTARFTAAAAADDNPIGKVLGVAGDSLTFPEIVSAYEKASGSTLRVERLGSLADLDSRIAEFQAGGPANFLKFLPLMYYRAQLNGTAKINPVMNDRYPQIQPTTVEQYVINEGL
ncbi:NmrA family NAD(P)-binding protein [Actinoplanes rectilineatus]|uniref:NmrA family NAD(P)-binding protein n=1 Tax=Actinoplanes rectilineatus TaxID=113571 RepID=UPI0005F277DE|nr:NmrA family NAD(P)-binding protein [Actinoplanes rectilineatus]